MLILPAWFELWRLRTTFKTVGRISYLAEIVVAYFICISTNYDRKECTEEYNAW